MESITAESLSKSFGTVRALDRVSLEIGAGELFFLLGPSGCGKSTLLRCIAGLERPDSGNVVFGGRVVTDLPAHQREAAMVFQSYALWPHLTVARNIAFGLEERKVSKPEIKRRVEEALELVQLAGFGDRMIDQMSGGQQQRVALARALVVRPKCLLLDEPLSNLDARLRLEMRREIRRIVKLHGLTAIYVTHDQEEALAMADRIAILNAGHLAQTGSPEEIYRSPRSPMVAAFIGETTLISATVNASDAGETRVSTAAGVFSGRIPDSGWSPPPGTVVTLSIRPEAWRLHRGDGENPLPGRVTDRTYLGQHIQYWIETALGPQQAVETNPHRLLQPGDTVLLHANREDVLVLADA